MLRLSCAAKSRYLQSKSLDWFLYNRDLRHERAKRSGSSLNGNLLFETKNYKIDHVKFVILVILPCNTFPTSSFVTISFILFFRGGIRLRKLPDIHIIRGSIE